MEVAMKRLLAGFASILVFCAALPADAQGTARDRAIKRCLDNRGTDCKSEEGLRPWMDEEGPPTYKPHVRVKPAPHAAPPAGARSTPSSGGSK
jgi:hypothetical protein